jgi:hypothetical protein
VKTKAMRTALFCALLLVAVVAAPLPARAADLAVVNVPADVATIQAAIDAVAAGGTVLVAPGTYREKLNFHGRAIEVRSSGGPVSTVIDGGASGATVTFQQGEPRAATLRGFTVRNGAPGISVAGYASPTITGNVVTGNRAWDGAGIHVAGSHALIENNVIRGNIAGGFGGGLHLIDTGGAEVVGNTIEGNVAGWGGGMQLFTALDVVIRDNVFRSNRAHSGGAINSVNFSWPLIAQNVFLDNEADTSGGALDLSVPLGHLGSVVSNNTMVGNRSPRGSAIMSAGDYRAVGNIMSGPAVSPVVQCDGQGARLFYNDVYNGTPTPYRWCPDVTGLVGNISVDPRLAPDFAPTAGSPVIDAGHDDPLLPLLRATDMNGNPRVVDGNADGMPAVDLGAFEWPGAGLRPPPAVPGAFHPLPPARILDSRTGQGFAGRLGPGATATVQVTGRGGVPVEGVSAVVLNVTVTEPTARSFLTAWPAGETRPLASNLNFIAGQTVPNLVTAKVGDGGTVALFNNAGSVHVVADVAGWYGPYTAGSGGAYTPLQPTRLLDTRTGLGAPAGKMGLAVVVNLQVTGRGGVPLTGVSAVVLNVTVTEAEGRSFLAVYPSGDGRPLASNLNFGAGDTVANLVVVKTGADGKVSLYNSGGSAHVIADVAGWFGDDASSPAGTYNPLTPARVLDTRTGNGAPQAPVGPGSTLALRVTGRGGVPAAAVAAVVLNVTVTERDAVSYLTAWPGGTPRPLASNLNVRPGQTVPNLVIVQVGADGTVGLYNNAGTAHVVADVAGWFGA